MKRFYQGTVTLTFLLFFSTILIGIFWLNEDLLQIYQKNTALHHQQSAIFFDLQNRTAEHFIQTACQQLPPAETKQIQQIFFDSRGRTQGRYCSYQTLFKKDPKRSVLMKQWENYVDEELLSAFHLTTSLSPLTLTPNTPPQIYFFNQKENLVQIQGKVFAILLVKGNLTLQGEGELRGIVISEGKIYHLAKRKHRDVVIDDRACPRDPILGKPQGKHCLKYIHLTYDKKINELKKAFGRWQLAEHSWYDFEKQTLED